MEESVHWSVKTMQSKPWIQGQPLGYATSRSARWDFCCVVLYFFGLGLFTMEPSSHWSFRRDPRKITAHFHISLKGKCGNPQVLNSDSITSQLQKTYYSSPTLRLIYLLITDHEVRMVVHLALWGYVWHSVGTFGTPSPSGYHNEPTN